MDLTDIEDLTDIVAVPARVKANALKALVCGVAGLIKAGLDIPTAYLERVAESVRARTKLEQKVALAAANAAAKEFKIDPKLAKRAVAYFGSKIVTQQQNREDVGARFLTEMRERPPIQDATTKIDEDWLTNFWRLAESKSSEDIKALLARLLHSEVCQPGSVSLEAVQVLSILTTDLARTFERFCKLSIDDGDSVYVIHPNVFDFQNIGPLSDYDVSYEDVFDLEGARLIRSAETLLVNYSSDTPKACVNYAGIDVTIHLADKQVHLIQFTRAGKELRRLISLNPVKEYTEALLEKLGANSFVLH